MHSIAQHHTAQSQLSCHVALKIVGGFSMLLSNIAGKDFSVALILSDNSEFINSSEIKDTL